MNASILSSLLFEYNILGKCLLINLFIIIYCYWTVNVFKLLLFFYCWHYRCLRGKPMTLIDDNTQPYYFCSLLNKHNNIFSTFIRPKSPDDRFTNIIYKYTFSPKIWNALLCNFTYNFFHFYFYFSLFRFLLINKLLYTRSYCLIRAN